MLSSGPKRLYYGWVIVAAALVINIATSPLNAAVFSFFVSPMEEDLGWSRGDLSWAFTFRLALAGISAPLLGVLIDRFGPRLLGAAAGLISGACLIGTGAMHDLWVFYALAAISGLAGFGAPAGQLLTTVPVAKWFHVSRGRALAIATVGLPLGTTIFIPVIQQLIDQLGWRAAWTAAGIAVIVLTVPPSLLFMRKDPESMGLYPDGADAPPQSSTPDAPVEEDWTASEVLRSRTLWMIAAAMALSGLVLPGTVVYRVAFWEETGLDAGTVAFGTALDPLSVTISALLFGLLAERMATRHLGFWGGTLVAVAMLPMVFATDSVLLLLAYNLLWGFGMGANITVNNIIWPNYFGRRFLGTIRGVVFPISVATSAVSTPLFAGLLDFLPDPRLVWLITCLAFLASGLLLLAARPPRRPQSAAVEAHFAAVN